MGSKIIVLVTGVGGCGVGEGVAKVLLQRRDRYKVIGGNMHADAPFLFRSDAAFLVPPASDPLYLAAIERLCDRENIRVIIPGSEPELKALSESRARFESRGIALIANTIDVLDIANDTWLTAKFLVASGFRAPVSALGSSVTTLLDKVD
jgi:carbamoyl-phosphate synthase large subunit